MPAPVLPRATTAHAASTAAFFLVLAVLPWLNPVSGGAMTPAIPLLVGWVCMALLFAGFPAWRCRPEALYGLVFLFLAALIGVVLDKNWQLLAVALWMMGASAVVGVHLVQAFDAPHLPGQPRHTGVAWVAWSWLLAGLLNAAIGLLQYFQATAWLGPLANHAPLGQVYGNMRQRNQFATLMNMALWALWYLWDSGHLQALAGRVLSSADSTLAKTRARMLAWLLMAPLSVCMALTLSRTGVMQLLLLLGMLAGWNWRRTGGVGRRALLQWLMGLVVFYVGAAYVLPYLHGGTDIWLRLEGRDSRACISRTVLWDNVLRLVAEKPLTGWGWGELDFAHYNAHYPSMRFCEMLDNAHNLPLHLAVELGVPAAVAACVLVLWWVLRNRVWRESVPVRQLMWGVLAALAVHSLLEYPLWYAPFQLGCGLACGVLWATRVHRHAGAGAAPQTVPVRQALWVQRCMAALLLAGLAYASFDYVRVTQLYMAEEDRVWPFRENAVQKAQRSFLYKNAVHFANLSMREVLPETAEAQLAEAQALMHYSPEARVVERIIECLRVLGRTQQAQQAQEQFRSVYPKEYERWAQEHDQQ